MSNHGQLTRDGIFANLNIKGTEVINCKKEATFRSLNVRNNSKFSKDVEINGNLVVKGCISEGNFVEENCNNAIDEKKVYFDNLESQYYNNGVVSWATFHADQEANKNKVVELYESDFAYGTLRVRQPCLLKFRQSVQFNPNRPTTWLDSMDAVTTNFNDAVKVDPNRVLDWFPESSIMENDEYFEPEVSFAYGLGFFAAIAIETCDVIVDLCGYTLSQHPEHALQQRFFALIELADQPFMPLQGPSNFGNVLKSAKNTLIKNGTLGLSSHHGIHGNDCDQIMLYNLQILNFEVAAVSLNGSNHLYMKNVNAVQNRKDVPVLATYSQSRFVKRFVKMLQSMASSTTTLDNATDVLCADLDEAFNSIIFNNGIVSDLFKNNAQVVDGTCYGFLINPKGVAVNTFLDNRNTPKAFETTDIHMVNCSVNGIKGNIKEIVALENPDGGIQVDTAGGVLQFFNGVANELSGKYYYSGTTLSEVQIELSKIKKDLQDMMQDTSFLGTLNIHYGIHRWQEDNTKYFEFINDGTMQLYHANTNPVILNGNAVVYDIKCNGDSMFHVNKGVMGYRIDGASTLCMVNCAANNIENIGHKGSLLCGSYIASHNNTIGTNCIGYTGADTFGAVFNAINDAKIYNFNVTNIETGNGCAHGVQVQGGSLSSQFQNINIDTVTNNASFDPSEPHLPNMAPISVGLGVRFGCKNIQFDNVTVSNVTDNTPFSHDFYIQDSQVVFK